MTLTSVSLFSVVLLFRLHQISGTRIYMVALEPGAGQYQSHRDFANSNASSRTNSFDGVIYNHTKHYYEAWEKSLIHVPAEPPRNSDVISKQGYIQGLADAIPQKSDSQTADNREVVDSSVKAVYRPTTKASSEPSHRSDSHRNDTARNSTSHETGVLDVKVLSAEPPQKDSPVLHVPKCKLSNCVDYLTLSERQTLKRCERLAVQHTVGGQLSTPTCRFMQAEGPRSPVALNSQEGSGNTWLRGLLEKATGICTGFYACDTDMRAHGFLGEGVQSAHVLVVKTHVHIPKWIGEKSSPNLVYESFYGSGILLIRNPARGAIAEFNRIMINQRGGEPGSHTKVISKEDFGECVSEFGCACYFIMS